MRHWTDRLQSQAHQARVRSVIENAFRRRTLVLTVEQSAFAVAAVSGGAALMLLLGTNFLNWRWLILLACAGLAVAYLRLRKRLFSRYRVAQVVDRRLHLNDSLSTAWFLLADPERCQSVLARAQIQFADEIGQNVDTAAVFPFVWKRTWAVAAALVAVAFGLFAVRYLVTASLDLRRPFVPLPFSSIADVLERIETLAQPDGMPKQAGMNGGPGLRRASGPEKNANPSPGDQPLNSGSSLSSNSAPDANSQQPRTSRTGDRTSSASLERSSEAGQRSSDKNSQADVPEDRSKPSRSDASPEKKAPNEAPQPSSGLLDRMKDALSGLMAKMRPKNEAPTNAERERDQQGSNTSERSAENNARTSQMQKGARNSRENQGTGREQDARAQSGAEASEKSPGTKNPASDDGANRKGSDAQSGIGRQDGEKTLKEAEQLRAMGKLDEIIGKRSASLTGDVMVETQSHNQQLQTQYSGRVGRHSDLGGEIDRDQVPVNLQRYVREYMDQVRKQANEEK